MVGTLLAFATYALGFVARPLGGFVFGHYGDKIGRKTMLYLTLLIMGVATAIIGIFATWLMATYTPATWPISVYMIILALITVVSVYFAAETRKAS